MRLACIRHAASVDPEPGSNSPPVPPRSGRPPPPERERRGLAPPWTSSLRVCFRRHPHGPAPPRSPQGCPRVDSAGTARDSAAISFLARHDALRATLLRLPHTTSTHPSHAESASRQPASAPRQSTTRRRRVTPVRVLPLLTCCPSMKSTDARSPCIAAGRKSLTPLPGLLERLYVRRLATCDLLISFLALAIRNRSNRQEQSVPRPWCFVKDSDASKPGPHEVSLDLFAPARFLTKPRQ